MLGKPLRDRRHICLEVTGDREVQNTCSHCTSALERMQQPAWHQYERALGSLDPAATDENAHNSFNDIESVVLRMGVHAGTLRVWLQPPFGDGVPPFRLISVRLEDG